MVMIGAESRLNLSTSGTSIPSGICFMIPEILSRISCAATSPFFSNTNCTTIVVTPSRTVDRSSSTPETVLIASSIGRVTLVSISSGLVPGRLAITETTGKSTLGNKSTPSSK